MQVYCRKAKGEAEMYCCVCGQGFVMFWDRQTAAERAMLRFEIQDMLRLHHRNTTERDAHPQDAFLAPEYEGSVVCAAAEVGQAPVWEL